MCHARRYCASHQEMREAVVRGLDGPGLSPLDVYPRSWEHVEGLKAEVEHRQRKLAQLQVQAHPLVLHANTSLPARQCS